MLELLKKVLEFAGHKSECAERGVMWDKGRCDCGWEAVEKELMEQGLIPLTRRCEHCGLKKGTSEMPTMGVCIHCAKLLCNDCIDGGHYEPGTCEKAPNKHHERQPPREFPGGPGGSSSTFMPGEGP